MTKLQEALLAARLDEERLARIAARKAEIKVNQSKYVDEAGVLRYVANGREVFPGPTGVYGSV